MLVQPQYSAIQKREVTTYLVSARDTGQLHCTIQQAVDKAEPYSRIFISPGQYYESVTINQPVELVGDDSETPEIAGRGVCLSVLGDVECYFENLNIVTKGSPYSNVTANVNAIRGVQSSVRLISGRPMFFHCEMSSVFVGGSCTPNISNCLIHNNLAGPGLVVGEEAGGLYEKNMICNHIPHCVAVSSRGNPVFKENDIHQDPKAIQAHTSNINGPSVGGCVLIYRDGTEIDSTIAPQFMSNRIGEEVVMINMQPTHLDAMTSPYEVYNGDADKRTVAQRITVQVDAATSPIFEENTIIGGHIGVCIMTGGSGSFVGNVVTNACLYGISLSHLSTPIIRFNTIEKSATGIFAEGTAATVSQNNVKENVGTGMLLLLSKDDDFRMDSNSFVANETGITIRASRATDDYATVGGELSKLRKFIESERKKLLIDAKHREEEEEARKKAEAERNGQLKAYEFKKQQEAEERAKEEALFGNVGDGGATERAAILSRNVVSHNKSCGVAIVGAGFAVSLREMDIGSNGRYGVLVAYGACPTLHRVKFDGGTVGLVTENNGAPFVSRCTFNGQTKVAFVCRMKGRGRYRGNHFQGFRELGVLIDDGGDPLFEQNDMGHSGGRAIEVSHGGIGKILGNTIDTVAIGIASSFFGDPYVAHNTIRNCGDMGIFSHDEGIGTFVANEMIGCGVGVGASTGGSPTVRDNLIKESIRIGVVASEGSRMLCEKNKIDTSVGGNILLEGDDSDSIIRKNFVAKAVGFGIRSVRGADGLVEENTISSNFDGGIGTREGGNSRFINNKVLNERGSGIVIGKDGKGEFIGNSVVGADGYGCELLAGSDSTIVDCAFSKCAKEALHVASGAGGMVKECSISENGSCGIEFAAGSKDGNVIIESITIDKNEGEGIRFRSGGSGTVSKCTITNQKLGLLLESAGRAIIKDCVVSDGEVGVTVNRGGHGSISSCHFHHNSTADISITNEGNVAISNCTIGNGSRYGVFTANEANGEVTNCIISGAVQAGIHASMGAKTTFKKNDISENKVGILCEDRDCCIFTDNTIQKATTDNVVVQWGASTELISNRILAAQRDGIVVQGVSSVLMRNTISNNKRHGLTFDLQAHVAKTTKEQSSRRIAGATQRKSTPAYEQQNSGVESTREGATCANNIIDNNEEAGVFFTNYSRGNLFANDIHNNLGGGVVVSVGATPDIKKGNHVHHNRKGGIVLERQSAPMIEKNKLTHNSPCNVSLQEGSIGFVQDNQISNGMFDGVHCFGSSTVVRSNRITQNTEGNGVLILGPNKHLRVEENEIAENNVGVCCQATDASGSITKNTIRHNFVCGVRVSGTGTPYISHNTFENGSVGLLLKADAAGTVNENTFKHNKEGLVVNGEPVFTMTTKNTFCDNAYGVVFRQNETYRLSDNIFLEQQEASILFDEGSRSTITKNKFHGGNRGVLAIGFTAPDINLNEFHLCANAVDLTFRASGVVSKNLFNACQRGVVVSSSDRSLQIKTNMFEQCRVAGLCVEGSGADPTATRNVFNKCNDDNACGLLLKGKTQGKFIENDFHHCKTAVVATDAAGGEVLNSFLHDNKIGIRVEGKSVPSFNSCFFTTNTDGDMLVTGESSPLVRHCAFTSISCFASVTVKDGAAGIITNNAWKDANVALLLEGAGSLSFSNNTITGGNEAVLMRKAASMTASVSNNAISGTEVAFHCVSGGGADVSMNYVDGGGVGILLERRGCAKFINNNITKSEKYGVAIRGMGAATLRHNSINNCKGTGVHMNTKSNLSLAAASTNQQHRRSAAAASGLNPGEKKNNSSGSPTSQMEGSLKAGDERSQSPGVRSASPTSPRSATSPRSKSVRSKSLAFREDSTINDDEDGNEVESPTSMMGQSTMERSARMSLADPNAAGMGHPTFIENLIHRTRQNVQLVAGEIAMKKNHIFEGDVGMSIQQDVVGTFDANAVHANMRIGVVLASKTAHMTNNQLFSMNEEGAIEVQPDMGIFLPRDNNVLNHCACKLPPPDTIAPTKISDCGDTTKTSMKNLHASITQALFELHTTELPGFVKIGCSLISGSSERNVQAIEAEKEVAKTRARDILKKATAVKHANKVADALSMKAVASGTSSSSEARKPTAPPTAKPAGGTGARKRLSLTVSNDSSKPSSRRNSSSTRGSSTARRPSRQR